MYTIVINSTVHRHQSAIDAADDRNLLIEAVKAWANCAEAAIDDGGIWIADPQIGHWLSPDGVAEFYAWHKNQSNEEV